MANRNHWFFTTKYWGVRFPVLSQPIFGSMSNIKAIRLGHVSQARPLEKLEMFQQIAVFHVDSVSQNYHAPFTHVCLLLHFAVPLLASWIKDRHDMNQIRSVEPYHGFHWFPVSSFS